MPDQTTTAAYEDEDEALYLDRFGDTWKYLGGTEMFLHVKRADETTPDTGAPRYCRDAAFITELYGPMTEVSR